VILRRCCRFLPSSDDRIEILLPSRDAIVEGDDRIAGASTKTPPDLLEHFTSRRCERN
jgi:hypothetical protein